MQPDLDSLLREELVEVPEGFAQRLMAHVTVDAALTAHGRTPHRIGSRWVALVQWLALAGGFAMGALQLAAFMFGLWTAATAG